METLALIVTLAAVAAAIGIIGIREKRKWIKYTRTLIERSYGSTSLRQYKEGEFEHIGGYAREHKQEFVVDTITWQDCDLDAVFKQVNYTQSSAGEEYLYYLMKNPGLSDRDYDRLEADIAYLESNPDMRLRLQMCLHKCGRTGKYSIYDYLHNLDHVRDGNAVPDIIILLAFLAALIFMSVNLPVAIGGIAVLFVVSGITYFSKHKVIEPYITCFAYVFGLIRSVDEIRKLNGIEIFRDEIAELVRLQKNFASFRRFSFLLNNGIGGTLLDVIIEYMKMFLHLDIIKFYQMIGEVDKHWEDIDSMLTIIGRMDVTQSILMFRAYKKNVVAPTFEGEDYEAKGLYHPLLDNPVANDCILSKSMLLTGSNASGKSTMIKTIVVNAILAQSIHTVCADSYRAPYYRMYTALSLSDNIFEGESYYMTEIRAIKRILDAGKNEGTKILACVDEVLRGTNTIERISAGSCILRNLSQVNGLIIAATHDLELTDILSDCYVNYHFEERIEEDDIFFPYKLMEGKATSRNAIALLRMTGYDESIVRAAEDTAAHFEATGKYRD